LQAVEFIRPDLILSGAWISVDASKTTMCFRLRGVC